MYRKIVLFYVFVLALLDISLYTKLSAQGKSHDVGIHDTLVEGITFQEWGGEVAATESGGSRAARGAAEGLVLSPPALEFGRAALAVPHARTVTLTNTHNSTLHLASVAGTTPDFHASFFESKTLAPQGNTSFSVVYLGRREGPVSAHLYIHTSLGVYKYPVSACGVASEWDVWPLVGVRVPYNATLQPLLTMHNPTDRTVQVSEVYSSGGWLGLQLPDGGRWAPRDRWTLPPHSSRDIVRLRLQPPPSPHQHNYHQHPLTAYIRIKANMTGGGLVVGVEARGVPPGEYVSPVHLPLRARGSRDPPDTFSVEAGNSLDEEVSLEGGVWGVRCSPVPFAPPPPPSPTPTHNGHRVHSSTNGDAGGGGGAQAEDNGVRVSLVRARLDAHQPLTHAAQLTLDYSQLWASAEAEAAKDEAWCAGWARLGRAALPYSLRLLPGTLALLPDRMHFVTSSGVETKRAREFSVRNEFPVPVRVTHAHCPSDLQQHFHCSPLTPLVVAPGDQAVALRLRLRSDSSEATLRSEVTLHTNLTQYSLPVLLYSGKLDLEWEWPNSEDGTLRVGAVGVSSTRRVGLRLHNRGPAPLCVTHMRVDLPGAHTALASCAEHLRDNSCRCVESGAWTQAWVTVVAPAREGPLRGMLDVHTEHAYTRATLELHAYAGRLTTHPLHLPPAAPYAWSGAPIVLESSMSLHMRVLNVTQPAPDPAVTCLLDDEKGAAEVSPGRHVVAELLYQPEKLCQPDCYTGLDMLSPEGEAWVRRGEESWESAAAREAALRLEAALQGARYALYARSEHDHHNFSLYLHTTQVVQIPVSGNVGRWWPRLVASGAGGAGLVAVGASIVYRVTVRNPSRGHALLLQPVLAPDDYRLNGADEEAFCQSERCVWSRDAFQLSGWSAAPDTVREHAAAPGNTAERLPLLLVPPRADLDIKITFSPKEPSLLTTYLYLRNNLTILEGVQLWGRGVHPTFELGGRRPGTGAPILFEVRECGEGVAGVASEGGVVRRTVIARNTGPVPVRLRDWRLAGEPCEARGFRLQPCVPFMLAPNETRTLHLAFSPDYSLARVPCRLRLRAGPATAEFALLALAPASLLPRCAPQAHRAPFERAVRALGTLFAVLGLVLVLVAATLDAERELRRIRPQARSQPPLRAPLDLRALAQPVTPQPPQPSVHHAPPRRRRTARRPPVPNDVRAERRAFERWRDRILRKAEDDDSRSSEDLDAESECHAPLDGDAHETPAEAADAVPLEEDDDDDYEELPPADMDGETADGYDADPESEERPRGPRDEDATSTDSASSCSPADENDEEHEVADDAENFDDEHEDGSTCETAPPPESAGRPVEVFARPSRVRRELGETRRVRVDAEAALRVRAARQQARRDKMGRRRAERTASPARNSPTRCSAEARAGAVRWGASWSSVVAAGGAGRAGLESARAPLPPIGSDVRRRAGPLPTDNSLFFFNGEPGAPHCTDAEYAWHTQPDYRDDNAGAFRAMGSSVWGGGAEAWGGGGAAAAGGGWGTTLRPPPGFPPAPPSAPARVYDPFRSLAAIWAPNVLHWNEAPAGGTASNNNTNTEDVDRESPR